MGIDILWTLPRGSVHGCSDSPMSDVMFYLIHVPSKEQTGLLTNLATIS
jgi:hypothetical protein